MNRKTWLFLDDSAIERRVFAQAIARLNAEDQVFLAATMAEAQDHLKRKAVDVLVVDYFLKGKTANKKAVTSERFIRWARDELPHLPIILMSAAAGENDQLCQAGADAIVPKVAELDATTKNLKSAFATALINRAKNSNKFRYAELFLPEHLEDTLAVCFDCPQQNVAIIGLPGMGKSTLAKALARGNRDKQNSDTFVRYLDCQTLQLASQSHRFKTNHHADYNAPSPVLFGTQSTKALGLLEDAQGGTLILDNAHYLNQSSLQAISSFLAQGHLDLPNEHELRGCNLRLIFTFNDPISNQIQAVTNLLSHVSEIISIPKFSSFLRDEFLLFDVVLKNVSTGSAAALPETKNALLRFCEANANQLTLSWFCRAVDSALQRAKSNCRVVITPADLHLANRLIQLERNTYSSLDFCNFPSEMPISTTQWQQLIQCITTRPISESIALLETYAYECAMYRAKGNKTQAAQFLGVARQSLYEKGFVKGKAHSP